MWTRILCCAGVALVAACQREPGDRAAAPVEAASATPSPSAEPAFRGSLYDLGTLPLERHDGKAAPLDSFRGSPVVISLFYASCPSACPRLLGALKGLERTLDPETRGRTRFLLVSLDGAQDTPEKLTDLATRMGLNLERWTLARASDADVRRLSAALGVKFRKTKSGHIDHSTVVTVLDGTGRAQARIEGSGAPLERLAGLLPRLPSQPAPGTQPVVVKTEDAPPASPSARALPSDRILVPGATYRPLYATAEDERTVSVPSFALDRRPVTNAEFLAFVAEHPEWRRDRISPMFAGDGYLSHWRGPAELGAEVRPNQPVVHVSWFAAQAYCSARGGRLPTEAEWELAAAPPGSAPDPVAHERSLAWFSRPATAPVADVGGSSPNSLGFHDLHGLVWEWILDYGATFVASDSRGGDGADEPAFCGAGAFKADRVDDYPAFMRAAYRSSLRAEYTSKTLGFRCAASS